MASLRVDGYLLHTEGVVLQMIHCIDIVYNKFMGM